MKRLSALFFLVLIVAAPPARARVDRVELPVREEIAENGWFEDAGPFEKLTGKIYFSIDPAQRQNLPVVDADKAPRNAQGRVEFSADLCILKPKDNARSNGVILYEVANRGGKSILKYFDAAPPGWNPIRRGDFGDGFLLEQGYTIVWVGWQWDIPPQQLAIALDAPRVPSVRGVVRSDFVPAEKAAFYPLAHIIQRRVGGVGYPVADPNAPGRRLTVRDDPDSPRRTIPLKRWKFATVVDGKLVADRENVWLDTGFEPGKIYEVVYTAESPAVAGLGLAALRDTATYFKQPNPTITAPYAYAFGVSQAGRFLRQMVYDGLNEGEDGKRALDGLLIYIAGAGRGSFNHRFAHPSRDAQAFASFDYPVDVFPFADVPLRDPQTGVTRGLLDASLAQGMAPKIVYMNSSSEYWGRAASLTHTTPDGTKDVEPPPNVRSYFIAGMQHIPAPFPPLVPSTLPLELRTHYVENSIVATWFLRAFLVAMDAWVKNGVEPPPSRYPTVADKSLVPYESLQFPNIPGAPLPRYYHGVYALDFGPRFSEGVITNDPPVRGMRYGVLLPQVDKDGNEVAGARPPELSVPLATYTGWNVRAPEIGRPDQLINQSGAYLPFARTRAERELNGDPRLSIEERYGSKQQYLGMYAEAVLALVKERYLLGRDAGKLLNNAIAQWDYVQHPAIAVKP